MREELSPSRKKESIIALFLYVASDKLQELLHCLFLRDDNRNYCYPSVHSFSSFSFKEYSLGNHFLHNFSSQCLENLKAKALI